MYKTEKCGTQSAKERLDKLAKNVVLMDHGLYVVYIWEKSSAHALCGVSGVASSLPLMNSFNKTEAAFYSCRLCFLGAFPFLSFVKIAHEVHNVQNKVIIWLYS